MAALLMLAVELAGSALTCHVSKRQRASRLAWHQGRCGIDTCCGLMHAWAAHREDFERAAALFAPVDPQPSSVAGDGSADDMFADSDDEAGAPGPSTRPSPPDPSSAAQRPAPGTAAGAPPGGAGPSRGGADSGAEPDAPAAQVAAAPAVAQDGGSGAQRASASAAEARDGTAGANGTPCAAAAPAGNGHAAAAAPAQEADEYASWPVKELRRFLQERGADLGGIVDKSELVAKVRVRTCSPLQAIWGLVLGRLLWLTDGVLGATQATGRFGAFSQVNASRGVRTWVHCICMVSPAACLRRAAAMLRRTAWATTVHTSLLVLSQIVQACLPACLGQVREAAAAGPEGEAAAPPPGYAYDPASGLYADGSGMFYDARSGGYYASATGLWYGVDAGGQYVPWPEQGGAGSGAAPA